MIKFQAQNLLDAAILDYLSIRGFHQTKNAFINDTNSFNQNPDSVNFPHETFLQMWWLKFYEAFNSRFPNHPILSESFDKVALTVKGVVVNDSNHTEAYNNVDANQPYDFNHTEAYNNVDANQPYDFNHTEAYNNVDANQPYDFNHTEAYNNVDANQTYDFNPMEMNTSDVVPEMPSTNVMECNGFDTTTDMFSYLMSDIEDIPNLSFLGTNETDDMLSFESNPGVTPESISAPSVPQAVEAAHSRPEMSQYHNPPQVPYHNPQQVPPNHIPQQVPNHSPQQAESYGINIGGTTVMNTNMHAITNALPTSTEPLWEGNNISLQQAYSHQGWPSVDVLPNVAAVQTMDQFKLPAPTSSCDFFHGLTHGDSSGINAGVLGDTNQRTLENSLAGQQNIAPIGGNMRRYGKQPAIIQSGTKRKSPWSSMASDVFPNVAVQTLDQLKLPSPTSSRAFVHSLTHGDSSGKDPGVLGDTNQRTLESSLADQQIRVPIGGKMRRYGKQPVLDIGRKRKSTWSYIASVQKDSTIFRDTVRNNCEIGGSSNSIYGFTEIAKPNGPSIKEIQNFYATNTKHLCCHFSSQGEFFATAGHDGQVLIWDMGRNNVSTIDGHAYDVTDVRFRPNSTVIATSSLDKTVKIWDAAKPSNTFLNLVGHGEHVMSIDYHPTIMGILSSCASNDEIRLWDVNRRDCTLSFKGGSRQVRFQPEHGVLLASSTENIINIFDIENKTIRNRFQGHVQNVRGICWDMSGNLLASVSEDSARIWSIKDGKCIFELFSSGNKFESCTFHPGYILSLVIGSDKVVELWNPVHQSNVTYPHIAHDGIISSLAVSHDKGFIASVSHDQWIKIWR